MPVQSRFEIENEDNGENSSLPSLTKYSRSNILNFRKLLLIMFAAAIFLAEKSVSIRRKADTNNFFKEVFPETDKDDETKISKLTASEANTNKKEMLEGAKGNGINRYGVTASKAKSLYHVEEETSEAGKEEKTDISGSKLTTPSKANINNKDKSEAGEGNEVDVATVALSRTNSLDHVTEKITEASEKDKANISAVEWIPSPVIYGLVHMAKTGGTTINGLMAMKYERVCGNKGYSYDAYQANERFKKSPAESSRYNANDLISKVGHDHMHNRGQIPPPIVSMVGFEDCDYIAQEIWASGWQKHLKHLNRPIELHVPCRDPIDHIMSMCNYWHKKIDCSVSNEELRVQVDRCLAFVNRFSPDMASSRNFSMKCFSSPSKIDDYIKYMDKRLQMKEVQTEYAARATNVQRDKKKECIWGEDDVRNRIEEILMNHPGGYFKFCKSCIGSRNDLFFN